MKNSSIRLFSRHSMAFKADDVMVFLYTRIECMTDNSVIFEIIDFTIFMFILGSSVKKINILELFKLEVAIYGSDWKDTVYPPFL